jgi:hypothetical protein
MLLGSFVPVEAQTPAKLVSPPTDFEIGRQTFFDFGPPFDYLEILVVRPNANGSSIKRVLLTPPGDHCLTPAKVETSDATLNESVSALFGKTNPCSIPEKELHRELKRCKHCPVFSGVNVTMRVSCGAKSRLIRSDILDKDLFDPNAKTPEHTSWTMQLLSRLDAALGPGVMEKPAFSMPGDLAAQTPKLDPTIEKKLDSGMFDELFPGFNQKVSLLYREAQEIPPVPSIQLISSAPFNPLDLTLPQYPPLAKAARVQGIVSFSLILDGDANPTLPTFTEGNPLFRGAISDAVKRWKYPKEAAGQLILVVMDFNLNCPNPGK